MANNRLKLPLGLVQQGDYLQWVSKFADVDVGTIIGKNDNTDVIGLSNYKKLLDDLPNKNRHSTGIVCEVNLMKKMANFFMKY